MVDLLCADNSAVLSVLQRKEVRSSIVDFLLQDENLLLSASSLVEGNRTDAARDSISTVEPANLVEFLKRFVAESCAPATSTAAGMLSSFAHAQGAKAIRTGLPSVDKQLKGGIKYGLVTELVGRAGSGKSYACLRATLCTLMHDEGSVVVYIDTEHSFSALRLKNTCEEMQLDVHDFMSRIILFEAFDAYEVFRLFSRVEAYCASECGANKPIRMLVLDSVASIGRPMLGSGFGGQAMLTYLVSTMRQLGHLFGMAIVVTNTTVGDREHGVDGEHAVKAALGKAWTFAPNQRVQVALDPAGTVSEK